MLAGRCVLECHSPRLRRHYRHHSCQFSLPPRCSDTGEMAVVLLLASLLAAPCTSLRIRRDAACDEVMAAFDTCTEA